MSTIPLVFRRFIPQLLHIIVLPIFFFIFMLIYRPMEVTDFFGREWFGVHITIVSCIIFLSIGLSRILYYFLPLSLNYTLYIFWCLAETVFTSFFSALYIYLVLHRPMPYFDVLTYLFQLISMALVFPYSVLGLSLRISEYSRKTSESDDSTNQRMRFYDEKHNLKIVLSAQAILYIEADTNYVNIYYIENGKTRSYILRNSMKAIDELCQDHGLLRCHRSFYVNPVHVKVLRKDREGVIFAELDADTRHIPVTKRYYDRLAELLY